MGILYPYKVTLGLFFNHNNESLSFTDKMEVVVVEEWITGLPIGAIRGVKTNE